MAILNIILKTVKPDERIYVSIYRNLNFLFFETADRFPSQLQFLSDKCYVGISVYKSDRVS